MSVQLKSCSCREVPLDIVIPDHCHKHDNIKISRTDVTQEIYQTISVQPYTEKSTLIKKEVEVATLANHFCRGKFKMVP